MTAGKRVYVKAKIAKRLDTIKDKFDRNSYSEAIAYALKKAKLWDVCEE